jgi:hypothetical protein
VTTSGQFQERGNRRFQFPDEDPNLPRRTDTSEWPQVSFTAGALASTLPDLHARGVALGEGFSLTAALRRARVGDELGVAVQHDPKRSFSLTTLTLHCVRFSLRSKG